MTVLSDHKLEFNVSSCHPWIPSSLIHCCGNKNQHIVPHRLDLTNLPAILKYLTAQHTTMITSHVLSPITFNYPLNLSLSCPVLNTGIEHLHLYTTQYVSGTQYSSSTDFPLAPTFLCWLSSQLSVSSTEFSPVSSWLPSFHPYTQSLLNTYHGRPHTYCHITNAGLPLFPGHIIPRFTLIAGDMQINEVIICL